jgi:CRISPR-associated protein Csb2
MAYLLLTVRWLDNRYHGLLGRDGPSEWPPSPFRMFQALVSGTARRGELDSELGQSLMWLQTLDPPTIIAPRVCNGRVVTRFVPNNDGDKKPDRQDRLKGKTFRPILLLDRPEVHYLWPISPDQLSQARCVCQTARYLTCLGWGIDMAYSDGAVIDGEENARLRGTRWYPRKGVAKDSDLLRAPVFDYESKENSLDDLRRVHQSVLDRTPRDSALNTVTKPRIFQRLLYESTERLAAPPLATFLLRRLDDSGFRPFDPARHGLTVAGMMRHAAKAAAVANGWSEADINTIILGHGEAKSAGAHVAVGPRRFAYLPLPSIEPRGAGSPGVVGSVRRIIVSSFAEDLADKIGWAEQTLSGQELIDEHLKEPVAMLSSIPELDTVVGRYTQPSTSWATVTPVVLPGYDDPDHFRRRLKAGTGIDEQRRLLNLLHRRIDNLLRKTIVQAGFSQVLAEHADIEWRTSGFWPGTELAGRYGIPDHLKRFPRYHLRLQWRDASQRPVQIPGPICLGGGRFYGLGLFAHL